MGNKKRSKIIEKNRCRTTGARSIKKNMKHLRSLRANHKGSTNVTNILSARKVEIKDEPFDVELSNTVYLSEPEVEIKDEHFMMR